MCTKDDAFVNDNIINDIKSMGCLVIVMRLFELFGWMDDFSELGGYIGLI